MVLKIAPLRIWKASLRRFCRGRGSTKLIPKLRGSLAEERWSYARYVARIGRDVGM